MWYYQNKPITDTDISDFVGFVYLITNQLTGQQYIGKKLFKFKKSRISKGKRIRRTVDSDWLSYYGSNHILLEHVEQHGEDNFRREILRLCKSKAECNYYEAKYQFDYDALLNPNFYNNWISVKVTAGHLRKHIDEIYRQPQSSNN